MKKGMVTVMSAVFGAAAASCIMFNKNNKQMEKEKELNKKNDAILRVFSQWMSVKQQGNSVAEYFLRRGYKNIAVYGMHYLGECLISELKNSEINIKYAIDRNGKEICSEVDIYTPDDDLQEVDAVVVTAFYYFDEIEDMLCEKLNCDIISIEDIIYEV